MTASQFKDQFRKDASGAIIKFIQGLAGLEKHKASAIEVLEKMNQRNSHERRHPQRNGAVNVQALLWVAKVGTEQRYAEKTASFIKPQAQLKCFAIRYILQAKK